MGPVGDFLDSEIQDSRDCFCWWGGFLMHVFCGTSEVVVVFCMMFFFADLSLYMYTYMGGSLNGGEIPNNHGIFLPKMIILGCFGGTTIEGNTHIFISERK